MTIRMTNASWDRGHPLTCSGRRDGRVSVFIRWLPSIMATKLTIAFDRVMTSPAIRPFLARGRVT